MTEKGTDCDERLMNCELNDSPPSANGDRDKPAFNYSAHDFPKPYPNPIKYRKEHSLRLIDNDLRILKIEARNEN